MYVRCRYCVRVFLSCCVHSVYDSQVSCLLPWEGEGWSEMGEGRGRERAWEENEDGMEVQEMKMREK